MRMRGTFIVVAGVALVAALVSVRARNDEAPRPQRTAAAGPRAASERGAVPQLPEPPGLVGVFVAREAAELAPLIAGRLDAVHVRIGDEVKSGQLLASIDMRAETLDLAVAQARADEARSDWEVAREQARAAGQEQRRAEALLQLGAASGEERSKAAELERTAQLRQRAARARFTYHYKSAKRARRDRDEASLRAPFEGWVVARYADPGELVRPERALLRVVRRGAVIVRFVLPTESARSLSVGNIVRAHAIDSASVLVDAIVRRVSPELEPALRGFIVEADVEAGAAGIAPGTEAEVFMPHDAGADLDRGSTAARGG